MAGLLTGHRRPHKLTRLTISQILQSPVSSGAGAEVRVGENYSDRSLLREVVSGTLWPRSPALEQRPDVRDGGSSFRWMGTHPGESFLHERRLTGETGGGQRALEGRALKDRKIKRGREALGR